MKNKLFLKYLLTLIISFTFISVFYVPSEAFSLNMTSDNKKVNSGDTVTVKISADQKFVTADFELKYDSDLFEYVEETQSNLSVKDYSNDGYVIVVYADISGNGTNTISLKFKSKKITSSSAQFSIQKQNFTDVGGSSYDSSNVTVGSLNVSVKENGENSGTSGSQDTNNGNSGTSDSQGTNSGSSGTSGSQSGNNGSSSTSGSQSGNNGSSSTSSSQNSNSGKSTTNNIGTSTQKSNGSLPKAGIGFNILIVLILAAIVLAIIFKKKFKYWRGIGMFILAFSIAVMCTNKSIYAYGQKVKYGVFHNLINQQNVLAISFDKNETDRELKVSQIPSLVDNVKSYKTADGNNISSNSTIGTGSKIILNDNSEYVALLYGDVNGDGKINSSDIYPIIQHILKNKKLTGVYAKAANLNNKDDSNDENINSSDIFQIIKFMLNDLNNDLLYEFPSKTNDEIDLSVNYDKKDWTKDSVTVTISSSTELVAPDSNWKLSEDKKQISKIYQENTSETVNVKSTDGSRGQVDVNISNIDKNVPTISGSVSIDSQVVTEGQNINAVISAQAEDAESGVASIKYEIYNGNTKMQEQQFSGSAVVTIQAEKGVTYDVRIYAIDKAGNLSEIKTIKIHQQNYLDTSVGQQDLSDEQVRYEANLKGLNDAIQEKNEQVAIINRNYDEQHDVLNNSLSKELEQINNEKYKKMTEIEKKQENFINGTIAERDNRLDVEKKQYDNDIAEAKKRNATTDEINDIKKAYTEKKKNIEYSYDDMIKNQINMYEMERQEIINDSNNSIQNTEDKYKGLIEDLQNQRHQELAPYKTDLENFVGARDSVINGYNNYRSALENKIYIDITE